jgi:5-methylcytosine-specific restriction endonuclease McrA
MTLAVTSLCGRSEIAFLRGLWPSLRPGNSHRPRPRKRAIFMSSYQEYLASDSWKRRRGRAKHLAGHLCQVCGWNEDLQVHHKTYRRLGHEIDSDLIVLCSDCHAMMHGEPRFAMYVRCRTCGEPGVTISNPDNNWVRYTCLAKHITERKL